MTLNDEITVPSIAAARALLEQNLHPRLREAIRYWIDIHPPNRLPDRASFDPTHIPRTLPHVLLTDVERDPWRFRYRVVGTAMVEAFGRDPTGEYLDAAFPDSEVAPAKVDRILVAETGVPSYRVGPATLKFKLDFSTLERVFLPLATDGATVDMILAVFIFHANEARRWTPPE